MEEVPAGRIWACGRFRVLAGVPLLLEEEEDIVFCLKKVLENQARYLGFVIQLQSIELVVSKDAKF